MKTPELTLNLGQGMEHFVIAGDYEVLEPMAEAAQRYDKANEARRSRRSRVSHVSRSIGDEVLEAPKTALKAATGRLALDLKTVAFDKVHGTDFYSALQQKRADERNLKFATSIGLVSLSDVTCRKHEHAIAKMRGL